MSEVNIIKERREKRIKLPQLFNDHFQNFKQYNIPKAQLILTDIPYNLWNNAYASNPSWYEWWDNNNWESSLAGKQFFDTDKTFKISEFLHFGSQMLKPETKETWKSPCIIVFCEFEQQFELIQKAPEYWFKHYINLVFRKNFSAQVLKANMKVVWNCEYAVILYRERLPKFNNHWKMIFNCMDWEKDTTTTKIHPTQKPIEILKKLIQIFTDKWDVVIDTLAGSGTTLLASYMCSRESYWFEIKKDFFKLANEKILNKFETPLF